MVIKAALGEKCKPLPVIPFAANEQRVTKVIVSPATTSHHRRQKRQSQNRLSVSSDYPVCPSQSQRFTFTLQLAPPIRIVIDTHNLIGEPEMATKSRRGQKQCPKCNAWVKGTRAKACPKCDHQFNGKQPKVRVAQAVAAVVVEKPTKAVDTVTFDQLRAVNQTIKAIGGVNRLNELLGLVKEVGGLRKMKDLLEAMSVADAGSTAV